MSGLSAYVPCFNNISTVGAAVESIRSQSVPVDELLVVDDGSTDGSYRLIEELGVRLVRHEQNLGRGAARFRAMAESQGEYVLCCDATNTLEPDFVKKALPWFDHRNVAAVVGVIKDMHPVGAVGRWRARHLFNAGHKLQISHFTPLSTFGTMVRAGAVAEVGGYDPKMRHSEDGDLGKRLLEGGFDVVGDPSIELYANVDNTLGQTLERYWRWYAGPDERVTLRGYARDIVASLKVAGKEMTQADPAMAGITLLAPHYRFWKSFLGASSRHKSHADWQTH